MERAIAAAPAGQGLAERLFKLQVHGTTVRTELLAGLTTFLTMAYILAVNPMILAEAGEDDLFGDENCAAIFIPK